MFPYLFDERSHRQVFRCNIIDVQRVCSTDNSETFMIASLKQTLLACSLLASI
jgi:hypothetical protein